MVTFFSTARSSEQKTSDEESIGTFDESQCDQIGQNFAIWGGGIFSIGRFFCGNRAIF
jgi:hypothetical protein